MHARLSYFSARKITIIFPDVVELFPSYKAKSIDELGELTEVINVRAPHNLKIHGSAACYMDPYNLDNKNSHQ